MVDSTPWDDMTPAQRVAHKDSLWTPDQEQQVQEFLDETRSPGATPLIADASTAQLFQLVSTASSDVEEKPETGSYPDAS